MAVDTAAKRMTVAGIPFLPLGVNVTPGTMGTLFGRATAAWNYVTEEPPPPGPGGGREKLVLGYKESIGVNVFPDLGSGAW